LKKTDDKIVTLETYYDPMLAEIIRGKLESNDIPCFIADDGMIGINPLFNQTLGGIKIKVFQSDLEKCKAIIAQNDSLTIEEIPKPSSMEDTIVCPFCGSTNVRFGQATVNKFGLLTLIVSFFLSFTHFTIAKPGIVSIAKMILT
jgi:hypothetical protein